VVIGWETIVELCPEEADAFETALARHGMDDSSFAWWYYPRDDMDTLVGTYMEDYGDNLIDEGNRKRPRTMAVRGDALSEGSKEDRARKAVAEMVEAWKALGKAFRRATTVGTSCLILGIGCVDSDHPDSREADPDEVYFTVDNAYRLTPAGKKFKDVLRGVSGLFVTPGE
jgi:hypothetical protein